MDLTFENLPEAVARLHYKLETIEKLLHAQSQTPHQETDKLLTVQETADFLKLSVPTIYGYVHRAEIPVCKRKGSKRLYFSIQQLTEWIKDGRKKTVSEIEAEAVGYLISKKKGGKR